MNSKERVRTTKHQLKASTVLTALLLTGCSEALENSGDGSAQQAITTPTSPGWRTHLCDPADPTKSKMVSSKMVAEALSVPGTAQQVSPTDIKFADCFPNKAGGELESRELHIVEGPLEGTSLTLAIVDEIYRNSRLSSYDSFNESYGKVAPSEGSYNCPEDPITANGQNHNCYYISNGMYVDTGATSLQVTLGGMKGITPSSEDAQKQKIDRQEAPGVERLLAGIVAHAYEGK